MSFRILGGAPARVLTMTTAVTASAQSGDKVLVVMSSADALALEDGKTYRSGC